MKMKMKSKATTFSVEVTFFYERKTIEIPCKVDEKMTNIFQKFINKLNSSSTVNDFDFFYEEKKLDNNTKILKDILKKNREIAIFVEKKSRIIKCPKCICNDSIISIDNYHLTFSGCKYNHTVNRLFNEYKESQKIDLSQIVCSKSGCTKNQRDDPQDFYKCLTCTKSLHHTKYYCNKHSLEHDKSHIKIKYDEKNYYCEKYFHKFIKYCFTCKRNLCHDCLDEHKEHETIDYNTISPNIKEIKEDISKIKGKINDLRHIIEDIKESLDGSMKIFEKYCEIANDIIEKYELFNKKSKNYRILKSIYNLKNSNKKIIEDLETIIKGSNLKNKINTLIDIYQSDRNNYREGSYNIIKKEDNDKGLMEWVKQKKSNINNINNINIINDLNDVNDNDNNDINDIDDETQSITNENKNEDNVIILRIYRTEEKQKKFKKFSPKIKYDLYKK